MSGSGAPALDLVRIPGLRVAVVASSWHDVVMDGLVDGAVRALDGYDVAHELIRVPGAFELPIVAQAAAAAGFDAVVALGVIIRGGTPHFDYVCTATTDGLTRVALDSGVPVGFGLLTCDTEEQAIARAGLEGSVEDKGREAVEAALSTVATLRGLAPKGSVGFAS
jgi:6,7-dimethyl-8-ribityllumazine synthase